MTNSQSRKRANIRNRIPKAIHPAYLMKKHTQEMDPFMVVLLFQITVAVVIGLLAFCFNMLNLGFMQTVKPLYFSLLEAEKIELKSPLAKDVSSRFADLRVQASDAVSSWITDISAPKTVDPQEHPVLAAENPTQPQQVLEQSDASDESEKNTENSQQTADTMSGAGGRMQVGDTIGKRAVPDNCNITKFVLSARMDPPVSGKVTSFFGYRSHPIDGADDFHRGLDIAAAEGSEIRTPLPGVVAEVAYDDAIYGNYITLDHGNGIRTTYAHCETIIAKEGEQLRKDELIATVGSTGISTGPHLHFEIQIDGVYRNPAWVVEGMDGRGV